MKNKSHKSKLVIIEICRFVQDSYQVIRENKELVSEVLVGMRSDKDEIIREKVSELIIRYKIN